MICIEIMYNKNDLNMGRRTKKKKKGFGFSFFDVLGENFQKIGKKIRKKIKWRTQDNLYFENDSNKDLYVHICILYKHRFASQ